MYNIYSASWGAKYNTHFNLKMKKRRITSYGRFFTENPETCQMYESENVSATMLTNPCQSYEKYGLKKLLKIND